MGYNANVNAGNYTNATAIGASAYVGASNSLVLGCINGVNGATANTNIGIGTITPQKPLEITSPNAVTVQGGSSGLRLSHLTTASPTLANSGTGVLSVNASGDVIYVPSGVPALLADNGTHVQVDHIELGGFLHKHTQIELFDANGSYNLYLAGQAPTLTAADYILRNVGIGINIQSCC